MTPALTASPTDSDHATVPEHPERPSLRSVLARVGSSLVYACVIPITLFYVVMTVTDVWVAILVALAWSYGAIAFRALTGRRPSGLLILVAIVMTARTALAMVAGSTFLYFLQPIISDSLVATAFLLSLATARPMVARLAGDFYPMTPDVSVRPRIQRLFRHLTLLWAGLCLGKALLVLWLLLSLSVESFVLANGISVVSLNVLAITLTIGAAVVVARQEGLLGPHPVPVRATA
ncbi:VC0807 family protein [Nocardioides taihuensis]|uniref:VC0807 family protein n=1 Tax=Nocardioides taihuensis TaxID=1835606 RepID=A0ABW0BIV7_9ACTN